MKGGGAYNGYALYEDILVSGFSSRTSSCGAKTVAFSANYLHSDLHPYAEFRNIRFNNMAKEAMFDIPPPPQGWANIADCGEFTCTGLYNVVTLFEGTTFTGSPLPYGVSSDF